MMIFMGVISLSFCKKSTVRLYLAQTTVTFSCKIFGLKDADGEYIFFGEGREVSDFILLSYFISFIANYTINNEVLNVFLNGDRFCGWVSAVTENADIFDFCALSLPYHY